MARARRCARRPGVSPSAPAIIGYQLRRGIVVDVGLPGFASHLAHDVDAKELVRSDLDGARRRVIGYLKRLVRSLAAYQVADVVSKFIAVLLLPVYTRYIHPAGYGVVELLANGVIFISILVRFGMIEAFLRYYFTDADQERRDALARRAVLFRWWRRRSRRWRSRPPPAPLSKLVLGYRTCRRSGSRCWGCGRSRTSSSLTGCCASTSGSRPTRPRR